MFDNKKFKKHYPYNNKKALRNVILCRFSSRKTIQDKAKVELFYMMNKIIEKSVGNFFFVLAKTDKHVIHTRGDLLSEAYIVLDICVSKYDIKNTSNFYFYFNKSLGRRINRIVDREYMRHINVDNKNEGAYFHPKVEMGGVDFISYYLDNNGFSEEHKRIIQSKAIEERVEDFVANNPDISLMKYYKLTRELKEKLKFLRDDRG